MSNGSKNIQVENLRHELMDLTVKIRDFEAKKTLIEALITLYNGETHDQKNTQRSQDRGQVIKSGVVSKMTFREKVRDVLAHKESLSVRELSTELLQTYPELKSNKNIPGALYTLFSRNKADFKNIDGSWKLTDKSKEELFIE